MSALDPHDEPNRVLVVDDDPSVLRILGKWLERDGFQASVATTAEAALAQIDAAPPDLLISDWQMPVTDGLELCRAIRSKRTTKYLYVLLMTASDETDAVARTLAAGADDFLRKPVDPAELTARMSAGVRLLKHERFLRRCALTDALTGLLNRRALFDYCNAEIEVAEEQQTSLACVIVDIDFFKRVNDTLGHIVGDVILRSLAQLFRDHARKKDLVCRYGGEEYCILMPETTEAEAAVWAESMRKIIADNPISLVEDAIHVTASFGVAATQAEGTTVEQLLVDADEALRIAKELGRNRVACHTGVPEVAGVVANNHDSLWRDLRNTPAHVVMTTPVVCLHEAESARSGADFLVKYRINSAPVIDDDGQLVGIFSERDVLSKIVTAGSWEIPVGEVMHRDVVSYDGDTSVGKIYDFLTRVSFRRTIIVHDGRPIGFISRGTLLRWLSNWGIAELLAASRDGAVECKSDRISRHLEATSSQLVEVALELHQAVRTSGDDSHVEVIRSITQLEELTTEMLSGCQADSPRPRST